jgi:hypothetical protein
MGISRQALVDALAAVRPGLANKEIVEQSCSFVFDGDLVCTYNDEIAVSHPVPPGIAGAVRAEELYSLLTKLPDEEIQVQVTETELLIEGKRRKTGLALQSKILVPMGVLKSEKQWKPLPKGFDDALEFCRMSVGADMTKPLLTCLHVKDDVMESCDNFRLGRWTLGEPMRDELLLPGIAAEKLRSYNVTEYAATKEWAHFRNDKQAVFSVRLFDGQYPDLTKLLAKEGFPLKLPSDLPGILGRAEVMMEKIDGTAEVMLEKGLIHVKTRSAVGWFEESARIQYDGGSVSFRIFPKFLREISGKLLQVEVCPGLLKFEGGNFVHACSTMTGT